MHRRPESSTRPATPIQVATLRSLAAQRGIELGPWLLPRAGTDLPWNLERKQVPRLVRLLLETAPDEPKVRTMPLKLNVGLTKKIGLPEYSSAGASINVEIELDSNLINDPAGFQAQVTTAYEAARAALDDQVARIVEAVPGRQERREDREPRGRPEPERSRASANGHDEPRSRGAERGRGAAAPPPRREPRRDDGRPDRVPTTGSGLWAWLKDQEEHMDGADGLVNAVIDWGKRERIRGRMSEWPRDVVGDAHTYACRWLAGDQDDGRE
jgi:hypothetical protein